MMGKIIAVCRSEVTGTSKLSITCGIFKVDHGLVGDAHAGLDSEVVPKIQTGG